MMDSIFTTLVVMSYMLGMVVSLDKDIVLRFGDNSLRIEKDTQGKGGQKGHAESRR